MKVKELFDVMLAAMNEERGDNEVLIEIPHPEGGYKAYPIIKADTDPLSGLMLIEVTYDYAGH